MKTSLCACLLLAALSSALGQSPGTSDTVSSPRSPYEAGLTPPEVGFHAAAGLLSEEGENDLAAAAAAYRRAIQDFDQQRADAANAVFRLGEVYRKMGRSEEAKVQYARILREFPDMTRLTELSHSLLFGDTPELAGRSSRIDRGGGAASDSFAGPAVVPPGETGMPEAMLRRYGLGSRQAPSATLQSNSRPTAGRRPDAQRAACMDNLKQLALAGRIFATDHQGAYPDDVAALRINLPEPQLLICPSDSDHSAAATWEEFDPAENMTYEYQGAGANHDEPAKVLFRCALHEQVALCDGSVQQLPATSQADVLRSRYGVDDAPAVAPQMTDLMRQRYGLATPTPSPAPTNQTRTTTLTIPITISREGEIDIEDEVVTVDRIEAVIRKHWAAAGAVNRVVISIDADEGAPFSRVAEVLESCRAAEVGQITVGRKTESTIRDEIERLEAEANALLKPNSERQPTRPGFVNPFVRLQSEAEEARTQSVVAEQRLRALDFPAEHLPALVSQDERYQRLKAEYETAVLDGDEVNQKKARERLQNWVEKIYRPELNAEVQLADHQRAQIHEELDDLRNQQTARDQDQTVRNIQAVELRRKAEELRGLLK